MGRKAKVSAGWNENSITALLKVNDLAVEKAIVAIYNRQTEDEKNSQTTKHTNTVGFSGADALNGSYWAKWIKDGNRLTGEHLQKARRTAIKYRRQLVEIANNANNTPVKHSAIGKGHCEKCANHGEGWITYKSVNGLHVVIICNDCATASGTYETRGVETCDTCHCKGEATIYHQFSTPVLAICDGCK